MFHFRLFLFLLFWSNTSSYIRHSRLCSSFGVGLSGRVVVLVPQSLRSAGGSCSAPVLHRCSARDYSSHVTLRNVPRSARCASLLEEPARSAFFSAFSLLPGVNLRRERDIPPSSPLSGSFQFAFAFLFASSIGLRAASQALPLYRRVE